MSGPLVTVVTPSYNQAKYIRATIESVLSQDYPNVEYIVMDGGSTDGTADVVREYSSRLTWMSERDRGQADAINKGFRLARGEILAWLNSDDIILPGAISKAVEALEADRSLGAVYGEGYQMDEDGSFRCRFPWTEPFNLWKLVYVLDYILQQTVFFRKAALEEVGFLNEDLHFAMDWDILIRIGGLYPIGYISEYLGAIREYQAAKSFSGGRRRFAEIVRMLRCHTGRTFPPGYFFYGLGIYDKILRDWITALTPSVLSGLSRSLQDAATSWSYRRIQHVYRESQGWYADGWAAPRLHYMIHRVEGGSIVLSGSLPDGAPIREQTIRLTVADQIVGNFKVPRGEFSLSAECPASCEGRPVRLRLDALRHFVPRRAGLGADDRKLSYQLKTIRVTREPAPCGNKCGER